MKTKPEIFAELTKKAADTYRDKNHDYGDSYAKVRQKFPNSVLIRLNDKLSRLEVLMGGELAQVKDENIDDTLLDLANYALMELTEREYERKETMPGEFCTYRSDDNRCYAQKETPKCDSCPHVCDIFKEVDM